jgi:RNA polymerase sigma-70 factor (ECF subfamily)
LYSIGKNKLLSDLRKKARISLVEDYDDDHLLDMEDDSENFKSDQFNKINDVVFNLGNPCKRILELFYFNKLSIEEIAVIMGYRNGATVRNLKYKCIQRIKKIVR